MIVLANADRRSVPIVINFPVFTQDQLVGKKLVIMPRLGLEIGDDVDTTNDKVRFIVLSAKGSKNDSNEAPTHYLVTKWYYQNVL